MSRFAALLFDFDGVLIESEAVGNRQIADYLTGIGRPTTPADSFANFMGLSGTAFLDAVERWARGRVGRHHGRGDDRARPAALVLHTAGREQALDDLAALARERGDASWAAATSAWRQSA